MELVILGFIAVWLIIAIKSIKKNKGCCGKCSECSNNCKGRDD